MEQWVSTNEGRVVEEAQCIHGKWDPELDKRWSATPSDTTSSPFWAHPLDTADIWGWWGLNLKYEWTVKGNQTYEEKRQHEINVIILPIIWLMFTECLPCARCFHHFIQFKSFNLYNSISQRGDKGLKGLLTLLKIYQYERNLGEKEKTETPWLSLLLPLLQNIFLFLNYFLLHVHCQLVF